MQRIDGVPTSRAGGSVHPASLAALAIGVAIGAYLSGVPAKSAEAGGALAFVIQLTNPVPQNFGAPKRVQTVSFPMDHGAEPPIAAAGWHHDGDAEDATSIGPPERE